MELLKQCDVVVTNPPFSLFREYVAQLIEYDKRFIIIGNQNAITYKEIFPLLKDNKMWLGYGFNAGNAYFRVIRENAENYANGVYDASTGLVKFRNCVWFTNIDTKKRHERLLLYKSYNPEEYPKYDNYDAINVNKVSEIPANYSGYMGVPITFMDKYNPEQFEIKGCTESEGRGFSDGLWIESSGVMQPMVDGKRIYKRIFIKKKPETPRRKMTDEEIDKFLEEYRANPNMEGVMVICTLYDEDYIRKNGGKIPSDTDNTEHKHTDTP